MSAFIYVPGLSRPDTPGATPKAKVAAFKDKYLTGVVAKLEELYTAKIIDCGKQLRWIPVGEHKKAWELLGTPRDNMLSRVAGLAASPPPDMTTYELREFEASPPVPKRMFLALPGLTSAPGKPALRDLDADDILYIVGHGNARGGAMIYKWNSSEELYIVDPTTLATHLIDEELPAAHKVIHVVMCFGGGIADETLQTVQPFAERLANNLKDRDRKKIKVVGATGIVMGKGLTVRGSLQEDKAKNRYLILVDRQEYEKSLKSF
jgi:hypothetical protein